MAPQLPRQTTPQFRMPSIPGLQPTNTNQNFVMRNNGTSPGVNAVYGANVMPELTSPIAGSDMLSMDWEQPIGDITAFDVGGYMDGDNVAATQTINGVSTQGTVGDTGFSEGLPETSGWGNNLSNIANAGNTLVGAFNAWTNYSALEETKDQNDWLKNYGTTEFNNAAQVYNQDRTDFLARTERAKGLTTESEARDYANKRMKTESVASI